MISMKASHTVPVGRAVEVVGEVAEREEDVSPASGRIRLRARALLSLYGWCLFDPYTR